MKTEPRVSIIILNWNGLADTVECLNSIKNLKYKNYGIVLVDNGSNNNEGDRLKELFPYIYLISNKINRGFAGGNNDGMNWAINNGSDYIVNLNNDCIVTPNWLSNLIDGIELSKTDFGSSMILSYDMPKYISSDGDVLFLDGSALPLNREKEFHESNEVKPIFSACGGGSIYSKRCLENIKIKGNQFFDELYFAYFEDLDLGIRLNYKFFKGACVSNAIIYHKGQKSGGRYSKYHIFTLEKNRILIELLNYPCYLIPMGEIFNIFKILFIMISFPFRKMRRTRLPVIFKNVSIVAIFIIILKARIWIITNLSKILIDRHERKAKGFINKSIIKHCHLNLLKF